MGNDLILNIGDTLTVDHDVVDKNGKIILSENQKVIINEINKIPSRFSPVFNIFLPERINSVRLKDQKGAWILSTFKETKDIKIHEFN